MQYTSITAEFGPQNFTRSWEMLNFCFSDTRNGDKGKKAENQSPSGSCLCDGWPACLIKLAAQERAGEPAKRCCSSNSGMICRVRRGRDGVQQSKGAIKKGLTALPFLHTLPQELRLLAESKAHICPFLTLHSMNPTKVRGIQELPHSIQHS